MEPEPLPHAVASTFQDRTVRYLKNWPRKFQAAFRDPTVVKVSGPISSNLEEPAIYLSATFLANVLLDGIWGGWAAPGFFLSEQLSSLIAGVISITVVTFVLNLLIGLAGKPPGFPTLLMFFAVLSPFGLAENVLLRIHVLLPCAVVALGLVPTYRFLRSVCEVKEKTAKIVVGVLGAMGLAGYLGLFGVGYHMNRTIDSEKAFWEELSRSVPKE